MDPKESKMHKKTIKVDIQGGQGGSHWDDGAYTGIREITLVYDRCIDSIEVEYDKKGKSVPGHKHGGNGGSRIVRVKLQYPEEYLTNVSGHYSPVVHGGTPVIRSLTFKTNQRTYGPYGAQDGTPFSFSMDGGHIIGFHGRSGWYLDAIGFRISHMETQGLCDALQIKFIKKFGELASKTLGYKDHDQHASAPNFKATT